MATLNEIFNPRYRPGPEVHPFDYNPSAWSQRVPVCMLATVGFLVAITLGLYQWKLIDHVWDPFFEGTNGLNGSEAVVTSKTSKEMEAWLRIPDGVLGAIAYLGDALFGLAGSTRRWQYRPWLVIVFGIACLGLFAFQGWALIHLRAQGTRIQQRFDAISRPSPSVPVTPEPVLAPAFDLPDLNGGRATLATLKARGKPLLLVFTDPQCGPCFELLPDLGGWERHYGDSLSIVLVSAGTPEVNRAMTAEYGLTTVLMQDEREVVDAYGIRMAPAAVVVWPDGRLRAEPVYGAHKVRQLVAQTLGLALPESPVREASPVAIGERVPSLRRPDLDGAVVDLAAIGKRTLLLFWSPGCHHCQDLLPEIKAWEGHRGDANLVVISQGPIALNREAGLTSLIVLDDDRSVSASFGMSGTPAALVIDERGIVVSQAARGATAVRQLAAQLMSATVAAN